MAANVITATTMVTGIASTHWRWPLAGFREAGSVLSKLREIGDTLEMPTLPGGESLR